MGWRKVDLFDRLVPRWLVVAASKPGQFARDPERRTKNTALIHLALDFYRLGAKHVDAHVSLMSY